MLQDKKRYRTYQMIADKLGINKSQVTDTVQNWTNKSFTFLLNKKNLQTA